MSNNKRLCVFSYYKILVNCHIRVIEIGFKKDIGVLILK